MIWLIYRDPRRLIVRYTALWTIKATIATRVAAPVNTYCLQPSSCGVKNSNSFNIKVMLLLFMIDDIILIMLIFVLEIITCELRGILKTKLCVENNKIHTVREKYMFWTKVCTKVEISQLLAIFQDQKMDITFCQDCQFLKCRKWNLSSLG
jgi:hypothetical protein